MTKKFVRSEFEEKFQGTADPLVIDILESFEDRLTALSSLENKVIEQETLEQLEMAIDTAINDLQKENEALRDDVNHLREKVRELDESTYLPRMHEGNEITHFNLSTGPWVSTPIKESEEPPLTHTNVSPATPKRNFEILFANEEVALIKHENGKYYALEHKSYPAYLPIVCVHFELGGQGPAIEIDNEWILFSEFEEALKEFKNGN